MSSDTLIFVHIPKTAGTTFSSVLFRQYPSRSRFWGPSNKIQESLKQLSLLHQAVREQLKLIYIVHAGFGIHSTLTQSFSYVSFLRDPWERTISDYFHACRNQDHSFYLLAQQGKTFEDFVWYRISKQGLTNPMTRLISGINPYPALNPLPTEALQIACANVENYFGVVGLQERYDESLLLMKLPEFNQQVQL